MKIDFIVKITSDSPDSMEIISREVNDAERKNITRMVHNLNLTTLDIPNILRSLPDGSYPALLNNNRVERDELKSHEVIIAWDPSEMIILDESLCYHITAHAKEELHQQEYWELPIKLLDNKRDHCRDVFGKDNLLVEDYVGLYGYLSYECGRVLQKHNSRKDKNNFPLSILHLPTKYVIIKKNHLLFIHLKDEVISPNNLDKDLTDNFENEKNISFNTDIGDYLRNMSKIKDYIFNGEIYQMNYTQRFQIQTPKLDPRENFIELNDENKTSHYAYLEYQPFQILSISPELFLKIYNGSVMTKPIKGTRPRGANIHEDQELANELLASEKDQAELAMIVDLLRNDLGKSSLAGSVKVIDHAVLESYSNVHHLVSSIISKIDRGVKSSWRLILRAFPGGSITGVPKLRAMEIIEELELDCREVYTGSIGYLSVNGNAEFNIAIRTLIQDSNIISYNAGGGIVADSDAISEYLESLHKAKHITKFFGNTFTGNVCWHQGQFKMITDKDSLENVFMYAEGFFETIFVKNSAPQRLVAHFLRIQNGMKYYNLDPKILPSSETIHKLVELNLARQARIRLAVSIDESNVNVSMVLQEYSPPEKISLYLDNSQMEFDDKFKDKLQRGLKPVDYRKYSEQAGIANNMGFWDKIIMVDDLITETSKANIYCKLEGIWYTPRKNMVKGIIREKLIEENKVIEADLTIDHIKIAEDMAVSNALIGFKTVKSIMMNLELGEMMIDYPEEDVTHW